MGLGVAGKGSGEVKQAAPTRKLVEDNDKCDEAERPLVAEYYQRCFQHELAEAYPQQATPDQG